MNSKGAINRLIFVIGVATAASTSANANEFKASCTRGDDQRVVEVISPGEVGAACDVRYFRGSNRSPSVPFHANNAQDFCVQKANELVNTLSTSGFSCSSVNAADVAEAPPSLRAAEEAPTQIVASADEEIINQATEIDVANEVAPASELEDKMNEILALPPQQEEVGAPANLTELASTPLEGGDAAPVVGRIIGAAPDEPKAVTPITQAALEENIADVAEKAAVSTELVKGPEPVEEPAPAEVVVASLPTEKPSKRKQLRSVEDVVRATLAAQAAAWNEGNLDAFMNGYWRNDGLKFVSNGEITKGWSATQRRYRDRYGADEGLGQLKIERLDVQLVTEDVAVVTGRIKHAQEDKQAEGVFSLVMRRDSGTWRIVHDHTATRSTTPE